MKPDFHIGDKARVTLGGIIVKGLNKLKVPGITRGSVKVEEFGRDFDFEVPTSASWEKGSISGNYVRYDVSQKTLRQRLFSNTGFTDLWLWENDNDFWAVDLAKDENSQMYVQNISGVEVSRNGLIPFNCDLLTQGLIAFFDAHIEGETLTFVSAAEGDSITDSNNGFIDAGFEVGMSLIIQDSVSNNDINALITGVTEGVLTLSTSNEVISEAGIISTKLHGGQL